MFLPITHDLFLPVDFNYIKLLLALILFTHTVAPLLSDSGKFVLASVNGYSTLLDTFYSASVLFVFAEDQVARDDRSSGTKKR